MRLQRLFVCRLIELSSARANRPVIAQQGIVLLAQRLHLADTKGKGYQMLLKPILLAFFEGNPYLTEIAISTTAAQAAGFVDTAAVLAADVTMGESLIKTVRLPRHLAAS